MSRVYEDIKNAEGYGRLSLEDKNKKNFNIDSESISSQRDYIRTILQRKKY